MVEWIKYTAYGIPFGIPLADTDSNGLLNVLDYIAIVTHSGGYDVRYDPNLDGVIDSTDATLANAASPITLGFGALSDVGNRKGYAGYEHAPELANSMWHVRNRVMISELLGRFITRDPIGYAAGSNLYQYGNSSPIFFVDPFGLAPGDGGPQGGGGRRPPIEPIAPPGGGLLTTPGESCKQGGGVGNGANLFELYVLNPLAFVDVNNITPTPDVCGWFGKFIACWKCQRKLKDAAKNGKCNRVKYDRNCYKKYQFKGFKLAECITNYRKHLRKCLQGIANAMKDCIGCSYKLP